MWRSVLVGVWEVRAGEAVGAHSWEVVAGGEERRRLGKCQVVHTPTQSSKTDSGDQSGHKHLVIR